MTLVAVLWLVSALALGAASFAASMRVDLRLAQRHAEHARAAALGDAVVRLAAMELLASATPGRAILGGEYAFAGRRMAYRIVPASGFVNLNAAPEPLLHALLVHGAGLTPAAALPLVRAILAWRTPDPFEPDPFEAGDGEAADGPPVRRRTVFAVPEDLLQVPGFDLELLAALRPLVSVYGLRSGRVDPLAAKPEVLAVLAGGDRSLARRIDAARRRDGELADTTGLPQDHLSHATGGTVYRIEAFVPAADGGYLLRAHWVALRAHPRLPWRTLAVEPTVGVASPF